MTTAMHLAYRHRKGRQVASALTAAQPITFPFKLPVGVRLFARSIVPTSETLPALNAGDRVISVPALRAGQVRELGWFDAGVTVEPAGDFEILFDGGLGRYIKMGA